MTQVEKDEIIKELQEKLAEAEKIEVDNKRWEPKDGEEYWKVYSDGTIVQSLQRNDDYDKWAYLTGNCFKSEKEAEEYKKQIEYTARYKNYIEEHSDPIDWNDENQPKYTAYFDTWEDKIKVCDDYTHKVQGAIYAVKEIDEDNFEQIISSEQIIWDAIKEIGEDNFKKYVLGAK